MSDNEEEAPSVHSSEDDEKIAKKRAKEELGDDEGKGDDMDEIENWEEIAPDLDGGYEEEMGFRMEPFAVSTERKYGKYTEDGYFTFDKDKRGTLNDDWDEKDAWCQQWMEQEREDRSKDSKKRIKAKRDRIKKAQLAAEQKQAEVKDGEEAGDTMAEDTTTEETTKTITTIEYSYKDNNDNPVSPGKAHELGIQATATSTTTTTTSTEKSQTTKKKKRESSPGSGDEEGAGGPRIKMAKKVTFKDKQDEHKALLSSLPVARPDKEALYVVLSDLLEEGETVRTAMKRLRPAKPKAPPKNSWKAKRAAAAAAKAGDTQPKQGAEESEKDKAQKEKFNKLVDAADGLLAIGEYDAYDLSYSVVTEHVKKTKEDDIF
eukprot:TRINITY_DN2436_c0_g1_i1.p1 TRINITY_DN2436_c0_g1~~TRINITY_DN2436_c0_g1_i1.p1  ORF type:complete len:386 (+),score=81.03 TRINITY_DN2436_c0_g1_i1:36-1160(+)